MKNSSRNTSGTLACRLLKGMTAVLLATAMALAGLPGDMMGPLGVRKDVQAAETLSDPIIEKNESMESGQKVTWDCVWLGSYPQTEIVDKPETSGCYGKDWTTSADYEVDDSLYSTLKSATGWDSNGDITISGVKYRRLKEEEATYAESDSGYFTWKDDITYHYFRYEKIKWRVLKSSGSAVFLVADKAMDCQRYHKEYTAVTWETSTIRTWLNETFLESAFSSSEQDAIQTTSVVNNNNINYGTAGGANTSDKVFLLSEAEVYTDAANSYGFVSEYNVLDEARRCKSSSYAKAMGTWSNYGGEGYDGNCDWWLRSPGNYEDLSAYVNSRGSVIRDGNYVNDYYNGARPALNLDLSSPGSWSYAGTVCNDGTVNEEGGESGTGGDENTYTVTYDANGGTGAPSAQTINKGDNFKISSTKPTRSGYDFVGWGKTADATSVYQPGVNISVTGNLTLYAIWKVVPKDSTTPSTTQPTTPAKSSELAIQPMTVKVAKKTVKAKKLKKKAQTVKPITVKSAQGTVSYKITGGNKKSKKALKINSKNGKITVKKKTKKGTYKVKVTVTATGNNQYKPGSKTVNVSVKVK